ncbi:MAG: DUF4474 domain-containing protein, partial [Clostridia bacterium]|nr:DUF4474 domain-containing protein [Clostridia bacterium]
TDSNIRNAASQNEGFLSYIFDPSGHFYYTAGDPWQRNFGFNSVYDDLAGFVFIYYDTVRVKFAYDNKDWMIQFWKGQYGGVFIGAEIGVYNKPATRTAEHYDCASNEDCLYMSMTCERNGEEIFSREYASYWWCTGFVPGRLKSFRDRSELTVRARITAKNRTMLKAFIGGLNDAGFKYKENYYVDGRDMYIIW